MAMQQDFVQGKTTRAQMALAPAADAAVDRWPQRLRVAAIAGASVLTGLLLHVGQAHADDGNSFAIRDVRVFDGQRVIAKTTVLVRDGRIAQMGPRLKLAATLPVIDGAGRTLLPGLIDAHTHTYGSAGRDALRFGVTTELDMFTDWRSLAAAKAQRQSGARVTVADMWSAGTLATAAGGHGTQYGVPVPTLASATDVPAWVAERVAQGSDYIKIVIEDGAAYGRSLPTLDDATVQALVSEARSKKLMAVAHVATQAGANSALSAGVNGLVHVFVDRATDANWAQRMAKGGTFVVPTLSVYASVGGAAEGSALAKDAALAPQLTALQLTSLKSAFPQAMQKPALFANALQNVATLHAAGVTVLAGTDAGNLGTAHGASLHGELALLVRAGLTPVQALRAATAAPAGAFGLQDRGRIATGLRADLVLVQGDPTQDIMATRQIHSIWKNGYAVDRALSADEKPDTTPAAAAPDQSVIADFETEGFAARSGQPFVATTDQMAGGKSTASLSWQAGGAADSKGALRIVGSVDGGLVYAWAGSMWMPGAQAMQAMNFSSRQEIVFKVKGDGRDYNVMVFSGASAQGIPAVQRFKTSTLWQEMRLPLSKFVGADFSQLRGIAFTAGLPAGSFEFMIDDIELR
jgi:imidazolonepropionase-like amidohydrolase